MCCLRSMLVTPSGQSMGLTQSFLRGRELITAFFLFTRFSLTASLWGCAISARDAPLVAYTLTACHESS
jgi:hypothetical protein